MLTQPRLRHINAVPQRTYAGTCVLLHAVLPDRQAHARFEERVIIMGGEFHNCVGRSYHTKPTGIWRVDNEGASHVPSGPPCTTRRNRPKRVPYGVIVSITSRTPAVTPVTMFAIINPGSALERTGMTI